ncbi:hypothetical protein [Paracoccus mutanolyticus]|uniref:hypothetical protein n=1 Tax=Paracoccus mutanolyticus TaxID=1499308 RepID=UPI0037CB8BB6
MAAVYTSPRRRTVETAEQCAFQLPSCAITIPTKPLTEAVALVDRPARPARIKDGNRP